MYGTAFSVMPVSLFFIKWMILFEFQPCGQAPGTFCLHLQECHTEHNCCRKCGTDGQWKHHGLIAGVDRDAADAYSGLCLLLRNLCASGIGIGRAVVTAALRRCGCRSRSGCLIRSVVVRSYKDRSCGTQRTYVIGCTCCHFTGTQVGFLLCSCKQFMLAFVRRLSFCCFRLLL